MGEVFREFAHTRITHASMFQKLFGETRFYVWGERRCRLCLDAVWRAYGVQSKVVFIKSQPAQVYGRHLSQTKTTLAT